MLSIHQLNAQVFDSHDPGIAKPENLQHGIHVRKDEITGGFIGLPESWESLVPKGCSNKQRSNAELPQHLQAPSLNCVKGGVRPLVDQPVIGRPFNVVKGSWEPAFAVPIEDVEKVEVEGYDSKIPKVLVTLAQYLTENGGLQQEGIFRLAPDATEAKMAIKHLDAGTFQGAGDVNVIANLIKVWFRQLPVPILNPTGISPQLISSCDNAVQVLDVLKCFPEPNKSIMFWLVDLMVQVVQHVGETKMNEKNMAIVMAPNLFNPPDSQNPMDALMFSQKAVNFTSVLLAWRLDHLQMKWSEV